MTRANGLLSIPCPPKQTICSRPPGYLELVGEIHLNVMLPEPNPRLDWLCATEPTLPVDGVKVGMRSRETGPCLPWARSHRQSNKMWCQVESICRRGVASDCCRRTHPLARVGRACGYGAEAFLKPPVVLGPKAPAGFQKNNLYSSNFK
jgi:hypothetical protein